MRINFEEVKLERTRSGKCSGCGKRTTRRVKVYQTQNPFNKNAAGLPKSLEEIREELPKQLREACSKPLVCTGCES